ncbi:MAG TPA: hypothetical protein VGK25_11500 [Ignavibacteria bacterium]|jgi:hypothetical protein
MKTEITPDHIQPKEEETKKPKSSGNKNFRKHNKLGFYRLMQRKKKTAKPESK